jgi:hypothetical protein
MTENVVELKPGIRIEVPAYEPPEKLVEDMETLVKMLLSGEISGFVCVYESETFMGHLISRGSAKLANLITAMDIAKAILLNKYRPYDAPISHD